MHVQEDEYFGQRVHNDIDSIMAAMKEAHASRNISAPTNSVAAELKEALDEVASFKGSQLERLIMLFCKQTKLKYGKLTEEEKQWLTRIAKKSELTKSHIPQRGKRTK